MIAVGEATVTSKTWHFCVLTPAGRGAIASIGLSGSTSLAALERLFIPASGRALLSYLASSTVYGRIRSLDAAQEDVVVGIIGNSEAEIHCHGGQAAVAAISDALRREGGVQLAAAAWVRRQTTDSIAAEALLALSYARTERTTAILLDQYRGALSRELQFIEGLLTASNTFAASKKLEELLNRADLGLHLTQPWKVVFTGRPNVGKSSLMNAILGYERSIVWHQPGTTRDVLTASTGIDGWWVELSDVAGLRPTNDALEASGVVRAKQEIAAADLVIFVAELTAPWDEVLYDQVCQLMTATAIARPPIIVHNKCDLPEMRLTNRPIGIKTSATTNVGLPELCESISKALVPSPPDSGRAIPFTKHHFDQLCTAASALKRGDIETARKFIEL
jgi:tRNA modification GTPase